MKEPYIASSPEGVLTVVLGERGIPGILHRVDWTSVLSVEKITKRGFQENHEPRKSAEVCDGLVQ